MHLMNDEDKENLKWLHVFKYVRDTAIAAPLAYRFKPVRWCAVFFCSKYDLYSKSSVRIDVEKVKPYYMSLIEKVQECRESPIFYLLTASLQHCQKAQNIF
jgi:inositol oxygenase